MKRKWKYMSNPYCKNKTIYTNPISLWDSLPKEIQQEILIWSRYNKHYEKVNIEFKTYFKPENNDTTRIRLTRGCSFMNSRYLHNCDPWNYIWDIFSYKMTKDGMVFNNPFERLEVPPNYRHQPIYYDEPLGQFTKRNKR